MLFPLFTKRKKKKKVLAVVSVDIDQRCQIQRVLVLVYSPLFNAGTHADAFTKCEKQNEGRKKEGSWAV